MRLKNIISTGLVLTLMSMASCSDDDVKTPLATAQGSVTDIAYTSLSFKWNKVADALQYDYVLKTSDGVLSASGVTQDTYVVITGLTPATEYTLSVLAYAAVDGPNTTSEPLVLTATTLAASQLALPQLDVEIDGRNANVTWPAIPDADDYVYELSRDSEVLVEGSVEETELSFSGLDPGAYVLSVKAEAASDAFTDSETTITFSVEQNEIWRVTGTYSSALINGSWQVTMIAYSDGSYELVDWYNTDNNSLCFYVDKTDSSVSFELSDSQYEYDSSTGAYFVPAGRSGLPIVYVFPGSNKFSLTGDKSGGKLVVAVRNKNTSNGSTKGDTFVWGSDLK